MKERITNDKKKCSGYHYSEDGGEWSVDTDYINGNIYLSEPNNDGDICAIENYGKAILRAVKDARKDTK